MTRVQPPLCCHQSHQSHGNGMCGYNVYSRILTVDLSFDVSIANGACGRSTVVLSSKLTLLSSNLEHYKLLWKKATNLS